MNIMAGCSKSTMTKYPLWLHRHLPFHCHLQHHPMRPVQYTPMANFLMHHIAFRARVHDIHPPLRQRHVQVQRRLYRDSLYHQSTPRHMLLVRRPIFEPKSRQHNNNNIQAFHLYFYMITDHLRYLPHLMNFISRRRTISRAYLAFIDTGTQSKID